MLALEDELATAAKLGQQILLQHDHHVAKAEQERRELLAEIERQSRLRERAEAMEQDHRVLEQQNHTVLEENLSLMKRLEQLHAQLNRADARNHALLSSLATAEEAVDQLSSRARAAQTLKQHVSRVQLEKEALQQQVISLSQVPDTRFSKAQDKIEELEKTLEALAQEADSGLRPEKRQIIVTPARERVQAPAETSFTPKLVADLFEQNASLASGAAELRRMLAESQEELAHLREGSVVAVPERSESPKLRQAISQELHHHHYHHYYHVAKEGRKKHESPRIRSSSPTAAYATPALTLRTELGLASPVSLTKPPRRLPRDSGYFSVSRDRSSSFSHPSTPMTITTDDEFAVDHARTPTRYRPRANSHHMSSASATPLIPRGRSNSVDSVMPEASESSVEQQLLESEHLLKHATSHESILSVRMMPQPPMQRLLNRTSQMRRPRPSPLQNIDVPVMSTLSADLTTARGFAYRKGPGSPRAGLGSYSALLRTAAAAQRQASGGSPAMSGARGGPVVVGVPPLGHTGAFWRRSSSSSGGGGGNGNAQTTTPAQIQAQVQQLAPRQRSAKWLEKLWHGSPAQQLQGQRGVPGTKAPVAVEEAVLEPEHVDEDLLKEALGL